MAQKPIKQTLKQTLQLTSSGASDFFLPVRYQVAA